jgi:hypothetical protein
MSKITNTKNAVTGYIYLALIVMIIWLIASLQSGIDELPKTQAKASESSLSEKPTEIKPSVSELLFKENEHYWENQVSSKTEISEKTPEKTSKPKAERIGQFLTEIGSPLAKDKDRYANYIVEESIKNGIHPYAVVAVAFADTTLGKQTTTAYNIGNVGNTDTCPTCQAYNSWEQGIGAIISTLNNRYLGNATKLCHLSQGGWSECPEGSKINSGAFYACSGGPVVAGRCQAISKYPYLPRSASNWNRNAGYAYSWLEGAEFKSDWNIKI